MASGGTLATVLSYFDMFSLKEIAAAHMPFALSPAPNPKANAHGRPFHEKLLGIRTVSELGILTTFIAAESDKAIVERTWGLFSEIPAKKTEFYGPNFTFSERMRARNWLTGILMHWGLALASVLFVTLPPLRKLARRFVYQAGQGPEAEQAKKDVIEYRAVGTPDGGQGAGKVALCRASFNGSMYAREFWHPISLSSYGSCC